MEIFFIGLVVVAIMAYVSTKIKRAASAAYEREVVENESFTITKPDGFLMPVKEESEFVFEAYSKDYGEDLAEKYNQCWAVVREKPGVDYDSEGSEIEKVEDNVTLRVFEKTIISPKLNKAFELAVTVVAEYESVYAERIETLVDTFCLK